jgi:hypothetical protein
MTEMSNTRAARMPATSGPPVPATAATAPLPPLSGVVQTPDGDGLSQITAADVTLAVWTRPAVSAIRPELAACTPALATPLRVDLAPTEVMRDATAALSARLALHGLPASAYPRWLSDMADLTRRFAALVSTTLDATAITLRLEALTDVACPRFHVDQTRLRLLCTYRGPGTEWLPPAAVDRRALGSGAPNAQIADLAAVRTLAPFWVGILKGERYPNNAGRGQVHRSPAIPDGSPPRVLFCLDA